MSEKQEHRKRLNGRIAYAAATMENILFIARILTRLPPWMPYRWCDAESVSILTQRGMAGLLAPRRER